MKRSASIASLVIVLCTGALESHGQGCGTTVYDTGGAGGNYGNNQNLTWTYCPPAGQVMTITFTSFSTEANWDELSIHNGPNNASPQVGPTYSGTTLPPSFTGPVGGCITLWFTSDNSIVRPGWSANITCGPPPPPPAGDCVYTLTLNDSWGDGWGSSYVSVSINGGAAQNYTVTGTTNTVQIGVFIGQTITLSYNNSGGWQNENSYTLTQSGGLLFASGTPPAAGTVYAASVDCVPPPAPPEDCIGATTICNNQSFNSNANGTGAVADLTTTTAGCLLSTEQQGTWYTFSPSSPGTVAFTLNPTNPADDYDFALWGPYPPGSNTGTICPPTTTPLRCSYAAPSGATGLSMTATDLSENAAGDKWVRYLNVLVDQVYVLYISNYSQSGQSFSLTWNLGAGASLDCTILPVELMAFNAIAKEREVLLDWSTASEAESDHFIVERSGDGIDFRMIGSVQAAGYPTSLHLYQFIDPSPAIGTNHYRLQQVDLSGDRRTSEVRVVEMKGEALFVQPNPVEDVALIGTRAGRFAKLQLFDMYGRLLLEQGIGAATPIMLDLRSVPAGSYVVHLISTDGERHVLPPIVRN